MERRFLQMMRKSRVERESNIILALDVIDDNVERMVTRCLDILEEVAPFICGLKLNRQVLLPLGLTRTRETILKRARELNLPSIMDCKVNDVGHTNVEIARRYFESGFDAITASPFVGWLDGLSPVFELARRDGRGAVLVVYMSHRGADEGYGQTVVDEKTGKHLKQFEVFAQRAVDWSADGAVVAANSPDKIRMVKSILGSAVPIYSPGVGVQGGDALTALRHGADYLIVGRSIFGSTNPREAARGMLRSLNPPAS